jgi:hypothetical protein
MHQVGRGLQPVERREALCHAVAKGKIQGVVRVFGPVLW